MQLDATKRKVNIYYNNEKSPKTIESYVEDIKALIARIINIIFNDYRILIINVEIIFVLCR